MAKIRIEQLDGIRALAVAAVLCHHLLQVKLLWMGVDLFFVLSGFLITGVLLDRKDSTLKEYFGHFYRRRARRILPPYLLLLLVTTVLFGLSWASHWYLYVVLMNFVMACGIAQPFSLCILWSLGVEEQFYLAWPFIVYFLSEQAIAWVAASIVLLAPLLRWFCTPLFAHHRAIYSLTPFRMDTLAAGALLALAWRRSPDRIRQFGHYGPIFSAFAACALAILARNPEFTTTANTRMSNVWIYEMTLIICTGILLWALSGKAVGILMLAPLRYLGRISYSIYLIHLTLFVFLSRYLHTEVEAVSATLVAMLLYASASWYLLEQPLLTSESRPGWLSTQSEQTPGVRQTV